MKDYLSYDIMNYIGVPAPLTNYAEVTVNGEDLGFYIALERYEKAFLDRVYDTSGGQLYNVKIQMGHREDFMDMDNRQKEEAPRESGDNESRQPWDKKEGISEDNSNESPPDQNRLPQDEQNKGGGFSGNMDVEFLQDIGNRFSQDMEGGFPQDTEGGFPQETRRVDLLKTGAADSPEAGEADRVGKPGEALFIPMTISVAIAVYLIMRNSKRTPIRINSG